MWCRKSKGKLRLLNETRAPTYTGWTTDEIQKLREGKVDCVTQEM